MVSTSVARKACQLAE
jgi:secreted protein with Ig-like and vWFA domain